MWFLIVIGILAILYVASDALVIVPGPSYGVHLRYGKRTGKIFEEGFGFKIPIIDTVELFSTELNKIEVTSNFTTKDKLQLTLTGSLQYSPDSRISDDPMDLNRHPRDRQGKNTFFKVSDEIIRSGIEDALEGLLGGLGGVYKGEKFISNRQALGDMINAILRLDLPPHLRHNPTKCGVVGCTMPERIDASKLVDFYNKHWKKIQEDVKTEKLRQAECSLYELRYGIDIETFALANVDFSDATKEAFEKEKQAEAKQRAFKSKMAMAKEAKDELGATAQEALNAADVSLDPNIRKQVVSVEGQAGVLGGIFNNMMGGK